MAHDLEQIAKNFLVYGDFVGSRPYGGGHINDTYRVDFNQGGAPVSYIFQRINHFVFKNPAQVMENIRRVTRHIRKKLETTVERETNQKFCGGAGGGFSKEPPARRRQDLSRRVLTIIPAADGLSFHRDGEGNFWRAYLFIRGARTYDIPLNNKQVFEAARKFGEFREMLSDLPGPPLEETIPDFHNAPLRFKRFRQVLEADSCNRGKRAAAEIDFLVEQAGIFDVLPRLVKKGEVPVRITHNDTKINNVLFDDETGEGICVIDLDTVMPGLSLYDFGDLARTALCHAAEDERDLRQVEVDLSRFQAIVNGYLFSAGESLKKAEREHLLTGAKMMTLLIGMRFLIDFLEGDPYYKTSREAHNLDRCRVQFKLVKSIIEHEEEMTKLIPST